jgi:hypothetical protein
LICASPFWTVSLSYRQIDKVNIDRQVRHVAVEEIDGGAALERKIGLRRDERDRLDQQGRLMPIFFRQGH